MKKRMGFLLLFAASVICWLSFAGHEASAASKEVRFTDTNAILRGNPYSGTAFDINSGGGTSFASDPAITDFINGVKSIPSDADIVRVLIGWGDFEPTDDQWDWSRIDQLMSRVAQEGKTLEIQLLMSESPDPAEAHFAYVYPPAWLFDVKNCPYRLAPYGDGTHYTKQPIYYSEIYLGELEEAIDAFAGRYDGNAAISWVDLRAFSLFGEWGGWYDAEHFPWPDAQTRRTTLNRIVGIYENAFASTMVMMQNAGADVVTTDPAANTLAKRFTAFAYDRAAANANWGFRSDTVNSAGNWMCYNCPLAQAPWINKKERRDHIQVSEGANWDNPDIMLNNPRKIVQNALEYYHANLQGINNTSFANWDNMKNAYGEWFTLLSRYVGYRFLMAEAHYNDKVKPGGSFALSQTWVNNGVGFSPKRYPLKVIFTNPATGNAVWSGTDSAIDQRQWFKGEFHDVASTFTLPANLPLGTYDVRIAMTDAAGNPRIELPMPDGAGKTYKIGTVTVAAQADAYSAPALRNQFRIEGEDYTDASGAYGAFYAPEGGGNMLYMFDSGQWAEYASVNVAQSGAYTAEFRVSAEEGNSFRLEVDGVDVTGNIKTPNSGGYLKFRTIDRKINLTAGKHTFKLVKNSPNVWLFVNWMRFTLDNPHEFKIQAENASISSGIYLGANEFTDNDGTVGASVIDTGDWAQYDNVNIPVSGPYLFEMRYSTLAGSSPQKYKLLVDGVDVSGELTLTDTGGVNNMANQDEIVFLTAGTHSLKVVWTDAQSKVIWNWMRFSYQGSFTKKIEAEHYSMQWNIDKEDQWNGPLTGVGTGTYQDGGPVVAVDAMDKNDYMKYENIYVPYTGHYLFEFRVFSDTARSFRFEVDGDATSVQVPNTGGVGSFATVQRWVKLSEGVHNFRIVVDDAPANAKMGIDWFKFTK
ncbi:carbohydrate-binding protein [Cohnella soli]|uniref:Carbohydrate-binding protein n=1 Tax=Cohnella soli TaxID=425005 RepID=A0ABW0HML3_9BACL